MLFEYLNRCEFDSHLERLINQTVCDFEPEEIEEFIQTYQNEICALKSLQDVAFDDIEAIDKIDIITTKEYNKAKSELGINPSLDALFRSFYGFRMSIYMQDDYFMLDRFEQELFDQMSNDSQKNYKSLLFDDWDASSLPKLQNLNYELHNRYLNELSIQLLESGINVSFMDVVRIVREFHEIYEPNRDIIDLIECFKDCKSFKSLIIHMDDYLSDLVYINTDEEGKSHIVDLIIDCILTNEGRVIQ